LASEALSLALRIEALQGFQVLRSPSRIELAEAFKLRVAGILASAARNSPASAQMLEQCALAKGPIAV